MVRCPAAFAWPGERPHGLSFLRRQLGEKHMTSAAMPQEFRIVSPKSRKLSATRPTALSALGSWHPSRQQPERDAREVQGVEIEPRDEQRVSRKEPRGEHQRQRRIHETAADHQGDALLPAPPNGEQPAEKMERDA